MQGRNGAALKRYSNPRGPLLLQATLLGLVLLVASPALAADDIAMTPQQAASVGIETELLSDKPGSRSVVYPARVIIPPQQVSLVSAPIAARVETLEVDEDQGVKQGTVLARLNSPALIRAQSEFLQAVNQERFLQETLNREQSLSSDRTVSLKQLQATRNEYAQATATVAERRQILRDYGMSDEAIASLTTSRAFDSRTVVTSPVDGVVIECLIVPGQRVEAHAALFRVARLSPLWLELQVPAQRAARFSLGTPVEVMGTGVTAKVIAIGTSADKSTQAVSVRAEFGDGAGRLKPGQFVEVVVTFGGEPGKTWSVKPVSVVRRGKDAFVFVRTDKGFRAQPVTVVEETRDAVLVTGDLKAGAEIAVRGVVALKGAWQGLGGSE